MKLLLFILLLFIVVVYLHCDNIFSFNKEKFNGGLVNYGYCDSCGKHSRFSCSNCVNCGFCITSTGKGDCVPGDQRGPYFRADCAIWEYGNPYYYYTYPYGRGYWRYAGTNNYNRPSKWWGGGRPGGGRLGGGRPGGGRLGGGRPGGGRPGGGNRRK